MDQEWTFGSNRFDMIRHAFLIGSISSFPELFKRAFDALKPGGSLQSVEMQIDIFCDDDTLPEDAALRQWATLMHEAFGKMGRKFAPAEEYKQMMEDAGFENVELRVVKRPMNDWPKDPKMKEIGRVSVEQEALRSFFCDRLPPFGVAHSFCSRSTVVSIGLKVSKALLSLHSHASWAGSLKKCRFCSRRFARNPSLAASTPITEGK